MSRELTGIVFLKARDFTRNHRQPVSKDVNAGLQKTAVPFLYAQSYIPVDTSRKGKMGKNLYNPSTGDSNQD
ncbi:MAG: hypothetical protein KME19_25370 [Microcoleus vaginatus WJT46-NPBG5]|jgi:hypothetical protein|nr:hypothetical protein [Microcoleus vaginatus WJT46-NPBG5]